MTLKELKELKGVTFKDILLHGINPSQYYRYEQGFMRLENMTLINSIVYADLFGLDDPAELLELEQPEPPATEDTVKE